MKFFPLTTDACFELDQPHYQKLTVKLLLLTIGIAASGWTLATLGPKVLMSQPVSQIETYRPPVTETGKVHYTQQAQQASQTLQAQPKDSSAYLARATALANLGERNAAVADYLQVMQLSSKSSKRTLARK